MAQTVHIEGEAFKKRNIFAVWLGLPLITLGIYHYVWYYKINNEARRYLRDTTIEPALSVLALFPGAILIVPPLVSVYRTGKRIHRMEEAAGVASRVSPGIGLLLFFIFGLYSLYYQSHLNAIWDRHLGLGVVPPTRHAALSPVAPPPPAR